MAGARRGGGITRRCECRGEDGKLLSADCPQMEKRSHGSYVIRQELPPGEDGKRRAFRRTGYATSKAAQADLDKVRAILDLAGDDEVAARRIGDLLADISARRAPVPAKEDVARRIGTGAALTTRYTVGQVLDAYVESRRTKGRHQRTVSGYESHIRIHLVPHLGDVRADRLTAARVEQMFAAIRAANEVIERENAQRREQEQRAKWGKRSRPPAAESARLAEERRRLAAMPPYRPVTGLGTQHAIRRTLRAALNWARKRPEYGLTINAAADVDLATYRRPRGLLWTEERAQRWRETGEVPSAVMVWTPAQLGRFLDAAVDSPLYPAFRLVGYHALRRSEAIGAAWANLSVAARMLLIASSVTVDNWVPIESDPKTEGSATTVRLDRGTIEALMRLRDRQIAQRDTWDAAAAAKRAAGKEAADWIDSGKIFTQPSGEPIHPEELSDEFRRICAGLDLPPINLRDLRHVGAGLVKAAGGDIDDARMKLRHDSIKMTSDTYMVTFEEIDDELTEGVVAVVPRARVAQ